MAVNFVMPFRPAFESNALPIARAQAHFYITGTTTPAPIYANEALLVELPNPLPANAAGRYPQTFLDPAITYRVRITDAAGELIEEFDPYDPTEQGAKGNPGGNAERVGTFSQAKAIDCDPTGGVDQIRVTDRGKATYDKYLGLAGDLNPDWEDIIWFLDAGGTYWSLSPSQTITTDMAGVRNIDLGLDSAATWTTSPVVDPRLQTGTDNTAELDAIEAFCAAHGKTLHVVGQFVIKGDDARFQLSNRCDILFDGATVWVEKLINSSTALDKADAYAIRTRSYTAWDDMAIDSEETIEPATMGHGCTLRGRGRFRWTQDATNYALTQGAAATMGMAYLLGDDLRVEKGITFDCGWGEWTILHGGDRLHWGADVVGGEQRPIHSDGLHNIFGDYGFLDDPLLSSGDDSFALGTIQFNMKGAKGWAGRYRAFSRLANACKMQAGRLSASGDFAYPCTGEVSGNQLSVTWVHLAPAAIGGLCRIDTGQDTYNNDTSAYTSRAEDPGLIHDNTITVDGTAHRNTGIPDELWSGEPVTASQLPAISMRGGENNRITASVRQPAKAVLQLDGIGEGNRFYLDSPDTPNWSAYAGGNNAVVVNTLYRREITDGTSATTATVTRHPAGFHLDGRIAGGKALGDNVNYTNLTGEITFDDLELISVTAGRWAFAANGTSPGVRGGRLRVTPASGSSTSRAFNSIVPDAVYGVANLDIDEAIERVIEDPADQVAPSFDAPHRARGRAVTIASGVAETYGDVVLYLRGEGGVADTLSNLTGAYGGQKVKLYSYDPVNEPITIGTTGNFSMAVPQFTALDTAGKFLEVQWNEAASKWLPITRTPSTKWSGTNVGTAGRAALTVEESVTASASYNQSEFVQVLVRLRTIERRCLAYEEELRSAGIIT